MKELVEEKVYNDSIALDVIEQKSPLSRFQYEETDLLTTAMPYIEDDEVKMVVCCERELKTLDAMERELRESNEKSSKYERELMYIRGVNAKLPGIIAESPKMKKVMELAVTAANFDSRVLILGETGTGKEVVAKMIYNSGKRKGKPFICVNCAAIPDTLMESELFGYEKGAFTGANDNGKKGYFEIANGGVLFLDEIGDVSPGFQVKLLRAIQEGEIIRVGGSTPIKVDVQIIAATNQDLHAKVEKGEFRADLYYRLNVFPIQIPALRERKEEIMALVHHFLEVNNEKYHCDKCFAPEAMRMMQRNDWPGNVRELENAVERMVLMSQSDVIREKDVRSIISDSIKDTISFENMTLKEAVETVEELVIRNCIESGLGAKEIEEVLDVSRTTLNRKIARYNLR